MNKNKDKKLNIDIRTYAIIGALFVLWIIFGILTKGTFFTARNFSNLFRQMSIVGILGVGAVLVIVANHIDLSVGFLSGFTGCISAYLMLYLGTSTPVAIIAGFAVGIVFGLIQGLIIAYLNVPSFITTLGGQMVLQGLMLALTQGITITPLNKSYLVLGQQYVPISVSWIIAIAAIIIFCMMEFSGRSKKKKYGLKTNTIGKSVAKLVIGSAVIVIVCLIMTSYKGIPLPVLILLGVIIVFTFVAEKTTFGRKIYAIGGNIEAAKYSGINIKKVTVGIFAVNGLIASVAGLVLTARQGAGIASNGDGLELDGIAAAVIGGASMSGGVGKVYGAIIGALLMATIDNGMTMLNMQTYWQYVVKGIILVLAVTFDMATKRDDA